MKKSFFIIALLLVVLGLGWFFRADLLAIINKNYSSLKQEAKNSQLLSQLELSSGKVSAPAPLVSSRESRDAQLSRAGVISWTNSQRRQNGELPALKENLKLNAAAEAKLEDMFKQQYFEHQSPQGTGPADLAKAAGYEYIAVGENLALGNFDNDRVLVQDWMDSPGHRANILNSKYEEIGVAVGQGKYQGKTVWLAVQEFGRPAASCPQVNISLKSEMTSLQAELGRTEPQLTELKKSLDSSQPQTKAEADVYNAKVADYNNLVKIYNNKVDNLKLITAQYNQEVKAYNACLE